MGRPSRFSPEVRERAIRLVMEQRAAHPSEWAALQAVATKAGDHGRDAAQVGPAGRAGRGPATRADQQRARAPDGAGARESRAEADQRDSQDGVRVFRPGGTRPPEQVAAMVAYVDAHRARFGVESICAVLPIAPSTYYAHRRQRLDPTQRSARHQRDDGLAVAIRRVYDAHRQVYGVRKVWHQLLREGVAVARCTVGRLMRRLGLAGAVRGRAWVVTTHAAPGARPADLVDRQFAATQPNQLWVADFTDVARWGGFV